MTDLHDAAINYARRGWPVFPLYTWRDGRCSCGADDCSSPAKHPHRDLARNGLKNATTDIDRVHDWWTRFPHNNIGLRTDDVFDVLDIDGEEGRANLAALVEEHDLLPSGLYAATGGGGDHLFFAPTGITNRARVLPKIDWRGAGGYIVAPPSRHKSGRLYEWVEGPDGDIPPTPDWLLAILNPPKPERRERPQGHEDRVRYLAVPGQGTRYGIAALEGELDELAKAVEGSRNHELNAHAFNLFQLVGGGELDEAFVEQRLEQVASAIGLGGHEIAQTIRSARSAGIAQPRYAPELPARVQLAGTGTEGRPIPNEEPEPAPLTEPGATNPPRDAELAEILDSLQPVDLQPIIDGTSQQPTPTQLHRDDGQCLIYPAAVNGIHGDSGSGKGWAVCHLITQNAALGRRTLLIDLEDIPESIVARLLALGMSGYDILNRLVYLRPLDALGDLAVAHIANLVDEHNIATIVIDSLGEAFALAGINEDKDVEVGPWLRRVARPLADTGAAVVLVDHSTKAADNPLHPSGSKRKRAAITGASYLVEAVSPFVKDQGGRLRFTCAKDRHGNYRRGQAVGDLVMDSRDGHVDLKLYAPSVVNNDRPLAVFLAARAAVEAAKNAGRELSQNELVGLMQGSFKGSTEAKRGGIDYAVGEGALTETKGARGARLFTYSHDMEDPNA